MSFDIYSLFSYKSYIFILQGWIISFTFTRISWISYWKLSHHIKDQETTNYQRTRQQPEDQTIILFENCCRRQLIVIFYILFLSLKSYILALGSQYSAREILLQALSTRLVVVDESSPMDRTLRQSTGTESSYRGWSDARISQQVATIEGVNVTVER